MSASPPCSKGGLLLGATVQCEPEVEPESQMVPVIGARLCLYPYAVRGSTKLSD